MIGHSYRYKRDDMGNLSFLKTHEGNSFDYLFKWNSDQLFSVLSVSRSIFLYYLNILRIKQSLSVALVCCRRMFPEA